MPPYGQIEVSWTNALLPHVIGAAVFYLGVLYGFRKSARDGNLEVGPLTFKLRTSLAPLVALAALAGLVVLGFVIWKCYGYSRFPRPGQTLPKALFIGLIPVSAVLASSALALLLYVSPETSVKTSGSTNPKRDSHSGRDLGAFVAGAGLLADQTGDSCVRCQSATVWVEASKRFRCTSCELYQPLGEKAKLEDQ